MEELISTLSTDRVEVTSFAVENTTSVSNNEINRQLDECFNIELWYQDMEDLSERKWGFSLTKESGHGEILGVVIEELDKINIDGCAYDCVIDVVVESCEILLQQVRNIGRKSLAMVVKIKVDDDDDDFRMDDDDFRMDDDDYMMEVEFTVGEQVNNFLSSNNYGVKFTSGDQINRDHIECCSICLDEFQKMENNTQITILPCSHVFHGDCLIPWIVKGNYTCPLCRACIFS